MKGEVGLRATEEVVRVGARGEDVRVRDRNGMGRGERGRRRENMISDDALRE